MTVTTFLIFLAATSLIVGYVVIIHRALSGGAANDPSFDADAPLPKARGQVPARQTSGGGSQQRPSHA